MSNSKSQRERAHRLKLSLRNVSLDTQLERYFKQMEELLIEVNLSPELKDYIKILISHLSQDNIGFQVHKKTVLENGETEEIIEAVKNWRESEIFTDRERAVLKWAEYSLQHTSSDFGDVFLDTKKVLTAQEITDATVFSHMVKSWSLCAKAVAASRGLETN